VCVQVFNRTLLHTAVFSPAMMRLLLAHGCREHINTYADVRATCQRVSTCCRADTCATFAGAASSNCTMCLPRACTLPHGACAFACVAAHNTAHTKIAESIAAIGHLWRC
jgi:hypothetical protein